MIAAALIVVLGPPAAADAVINGCNFISQPTVTHHTDCPGADLAGIDLHAFDLSYANLSGADLSGAFLVGDNFSHSDLSTADLTGTLAEDSIFDGANLAGATLHQTRVYESSFHGADLTGADLTGVVGDYSSYVGADFTDAVAPAAVLNSSDFTGATFRGAGLVGADLTNGVMTDAVFAGADLTSALVFGSSLTGADFTAAHLAGANVSDTLLVPPNQRVPATSLSGAVVSWPDPTALPGASPGACDPPSGSRFPVGQVQAACQVLDDFSGVAVGSFVVTVLSPVPFVIEGPTSQTVLVGTTVSFSAAAIGTDPAVQWQVSTDGGATFTDIAGATSTTLSFAAQLSDDGHRFRAVFSNPFGTAVTGAATLTVEDPTPLVVPGAVGSVAEGDAGTTALSFSVGLSRTVTEPVTVKWTTVFVPGAPGDQADPATDYAPASGTVTFAPGETSEAVSVLVHGDDLVEPDEYLVVSFHDPTNAAMGGFWGLGFGVVGNDDHATVLPGAGSVLEGSSGTTTVEVPVTLSNPSTQAVTVPWTTLFASGAPGDQATPTDDYTPVSGTVTFAPGETSKTVSVAIIGDHLVEPDEYLVVSFHDPTNAAMGGFWGLGFGLITNDD